jgi:hypothetical protein
MPQLRNDIATCFVHGHGASYSSDSAETAIKSVRAELVTPLASKLESAKTRAAAQLALQRIAILRFGKK